MPSFDYGPSSVAELQGLQLQRLKETLCRAYQGSAFYRDSFDRHGVHPDDLRSIEDLARFPFTTKADLRANYPFGMFAVPIEQVSRLHASSGTTGKPTVVGYTARDIAVWSGLVARSLHAGGVRPGMRVHVAYGYGLFTGGLGAHYGAEALGCTVIPMSGGQSEKQVQLIQDFEPEVIMVTPSYMLSLLDEFRRQGIDPAQTSLRYGVFGAEPWTEAMRTEIETSFNLRASDIYGLSEVMGPGVAQEILGESSPTIWEDHFLPEVIDPESGEPVADGQEGELVFTSLTKEAFPVVRYRTRDLTRLLPGVSTPMRRMAKITGRSDDMMIIRGVNVFPTQLEEHVLASKLLGPHFLVELTRPGRMDEVNLLVEPRDEVEIANCAEEAIRLANRIKEVIGITVRVSVHPCGSLSRSSGKASRVRDLRLPA